MELPPQYFILPLLGLAALMWGVFSVIRHVASKWPASSRSGTTSGTDSGTRQPPTPQSHGTTVRSTAPVQMKEIVAIVGGIVSIIVGIITIIEKLSG